MLKDKVPEVVQKIVEHWRTDPEPFILLKDERSHADSVADPARRPAGLRAPPAVGLRRIAQARRATDGAGAPWPDARGDGAGARGVHPAGGRRTGSALG